MNPFAAAAVKTLSAASAAALLSMGAAGVIAQAATPSNPNTPAATAGAKHSKDAHADRRAIAKAVFESEAQVLGMKPEDLRKALKEGAKVSELAAKKGMTKEQFADALGKSVRPKLDALVDHKVITRAQADRTLDRIAKGHIPFWNGVHHKKQ